MESLVAFSVLVALVGLERVVELVVSVRNAAWSRMEQAGAQLMSWFGVACELHRDWRNDVEGLGTLFANHIPDYRNLMASYSANRAAK